MKATRDIDYRTDEMEKAFLNPHVEQPGYKTWKKDESMPKEFPEHLLGQIMSGNPHWVVAEDEVDKKKVDDGKKVIDRRKELFNMNKKPQEELIAKLGSSERPKSEEGRVKLILKLEGY